MSRILEAIGREPWASTEAALGTIIEVAERENRPVEAIERELGRPLENTRSVRMRDGVAVIPVTGPLFRRANLMTRLSGATSLEVLATEFGEAVANPDVRAIALDVDSPGGQVNGTMELAELVFRSREVKPIVSFVSGEGQSGAFWIASAASAVVVAGTAILGSIGAVLSVVDFGQGDEKRGIRQLEIVSSQSPKKRLDPFEDEGRAALQVIVDDLAAVMIRAIARNRGVTEETVLSEFGRGGSFVGPAAVQAGLADRPSTLEQVIEGLAGGRAAQVPVGATFTEGGIMPKENEAPTIDRAFLDKEHPQLVAEIRAEGEKAGRETERGRILGIYGLAAEGFEEIRDECMADPEATTGTAAERILAAKAEKAKQQGKARLDALRSDEEELEAPAATSSADVHTEEQEADKLAAQILAAGKPRAKSA